MKGRNLPRLAYNWLSTAGAIIASVSFMLILIFLVLSLFSKLDNPYVGILLYMVLPLLLFIGLVIIPIGMFFKWRRWKKTGEIDRERLPYIDLNKPSHRNATIIFIIGTLLFIAVSSVGTYEAYHYSESVKFCGTTCHRVMDPEYTAYQNSPHARVSCTECHVGSGAGWYTKSKLSGLYQVYAVATNNYPRPIPTPVKNLRPAQETCEQCHWPEKFYGAQQRQFNHYMYDDSNTVWPINMLIKTGGGDPKTGQTAGIHWHMNINTIIARDYERQDIPWVKITDKSTGRTTIYQNTDDPLSEEEIAAAEPRRMDCMDCHNRPSHIFYSPDHAIDVAILTGKIKRDIPDIKRVAVEAMAKEYESTDSAMVKIANAITDFYGLNYAEFYKSRRVDIDDAIIAAQHAYSQNIFPYMKVRWSDYPTNIGHFTNVGCMRCHEGKHENEKGIKITRDCTACHVLLSEGGDTETDYSIESAGLEFKHPIDIDEMWREVGCYECHTGTQP
jgi:hypothetical protein